MLPVCTSVSPSPFGRGPGRGLVCTSCSAPSSTSPKGRGRNHAHFNQRLWLKSFAPLSFFPSFLVFQILLPLLDHLGHGRVFERQLGPDARISRISSNQCRHHKTFAPKFFFFTNAIGIKRRSPLTRQPQVFRYCLGEFIHAVPLERIIVSKQNISYPPVNKAQLDSPDTLQV